MLTSHCRSHSRGEYYESSECEKNLQTKENPDTHHQIHPVEILSDSGVDKLSIDPDKQSIDPEDSHSEESYLFGEQSL